MNWGHKIAIIYGLFMAFMIGMLFLSRGYDHELVTEDYYAQELAYQDKIDAGKNLSSADFEVEVKMVDGKLRLLFNKLPSTSDLSGEVKLYKPDDERLDETLPLTLQEGTNWMDIDSSKRTGRYKLKLSFEYQGKAFYKEKDLLL